MATKTVIEKEMASKDWVFDTLIDVDVAEADLTVNTYADLPPAPSVHVGSMVTLAWVSNTTGILLSKKKKGYYILEPSNKKWKYQGMSLNIPQVTALEKTVGAETEIRRYSPKDIFDIAKAGVQNAKSFTEAEILALDTSTLEVGEVINVADKVQITTPATFQRSNVLDFTDDKEVITLKNIEIKGAANAHLADYIAVNWTSDYFRFAEVGFLDAIGYKPSAREFKIHLRVNGIEEGLHTIQGTDAINTAMTATYDLQMTSAQTGDDTTITITVNGSSINKTFSRVGGYDPFGISGIGLDAYNSIIVRRTDGTIVLTSYHEQVTVIEKRYWDRTQWKVLLDDKNTPQVTDSERESAYDTTVKRFSPFDIYKMIQLHAPTQVPSSQTETTKRYVTTQMSAGGYDNSGEIHIFGSGGGLLYARFLYLGSDIALQVYMAGSGGGATGTVRRNTSSSPMANVDIGFGANSYNTIYGDTMSKSALIDITNYTTGDLYELKLVSHSGRVMAILSTFVNIKVLN